MRTTQWTKQRMLFPPVLLLAAVIAPGLLCPTLAGAVDVLDQSQTVSQSPQTVYSSLQRAQIFTAGQYGTIDRVSLRLENYSIYTVPPPGSILTVSIQTVIAGQPSGIQIGSGTISLTNIPAPGHPEWVDVSVRGAVVAAGVQYALVLQTSSDFAPVTWWFAGESYARGQMTYNDGTTWITSSSLDFTFMTYVVPDVRDQWQVVANIHGNASLAYAQTFTASLSGVLDRVSVYQYGTYFPQKVTIQTVTGGYPSGTVIGVGTLPSNCCPGNGWMTVRISGPGGVGNLRVSAGVKYALVLESAAPGFLGTSTYTPYAGGQMYYKEWGSSSWEVWTDAYHGDQATMAFETYVALPLPPVSQMLPPSKTPCSSGVCPAVTASVTPNDSTARITSTVNFREMLDGKIQGVLMFNDTRTGSLALRGCTTESEACRVSVTTFACTDQHTIRVEGLYTPKGENPRIYSLILSGAKGGTGSLVFTSTEYIDDGAGLFANTYSYSLTRLGIVDVTCPPL